MSNDYKIGQDVNLNASIKNIIFGIVAMANTKNDPEYYIVSNYNNIIIDYICSYHKELEPRIKKLQLLK